MRISISAFFVCLGLALGVSFGAGAADHQGTVNGTAVAPGADLATVIGAINAAAASVPGGANVAEVTLTIGADASAAGDPAPNPGGYLSYLWDLTNGAKNNTANGYKSVSIDGGGHTLSVASGYAPLLNIENVTDSIKVKNLTFSGGTNDDWGAGLMIHSRGKTATQVELENLSFLNNTANYENQSGGAGLMVSGGGGTWHTTLRNVVADNNKLLLDGVSGGNIWGAGIRLNSTRADYIGGTVSRNITTLTNGTNAYGGGMVGNGTSVLNITDVAFTSNTSKTIGTSGTSFAFGGGLAHVSQWGNSDSNLSISGTAYFDGNQAVAEGTASGHAYGGAVLLLGKVRGSFDGTASSEATATGAMFRNNTASSQNGTAYGGGIATQNFWSTLGPDGVSGNADDTGPTGESYDALGVTLTNVDFYNNTATGELQGVGGALFLQAPSDNYHPSTPTNAYGVTMTGGSFTANKATATGASGRATGGAADIRGGGTSTFDTVAFTGNIASATGTTSNAFGGAIYQHNGTLNLANATITGNSATGTATSAGGGVFVNTDTDASNATLNITAKDNFAARIAGNKAGAVDDDIYFGATDGTADINGVLNVSADEGSSVFLGATTALMAGKDFTANYGKIGTNGKVTLSGGQRFEAANSTLNFQNGTTHLTPDYTTVFAGAGNASVTFSPDHTLVVELDDRNGEPLFNFQNTGTKTITVTQGSTLDFDVVSSDDRAVESFLEDLVLARGVTAAEAADMLSKFTFGTNSPYYMQYAEAVHMEGTDVVLGVAYRSPFEFSGTNIGNTVSSGAIKNLVDTKDPITNIKIVSDDEFAAMLRNPNALHAELALDAGRVLLNGAARVSTDAIEMGLRKPHHAALQDGFVRTSRPVYSDEQDGPVSSDSANASTRLMDCARYLGGGNVRIWAGYIGDWGTHDADNGRNGYDYDRNGFLLGVNYDFGMTGSVGLFGGYSRTSADSKTVNAEVEGDNGHFGILGRFSPVGTLPELSFFADAGYHFADNDSSRSYGAYAASGSFDQDLFTLGVGGEYDIRLGGASITPFARFRYSHLNQGGLQEGGTAASATQVGGFTANAFQHNLGVEASYNFAAGTGIVTPSVSVDWQHNYGSRELESNSRYIRASVPAAFRLESSRQTRDTVNLAAGVGGAFNIGSADLYAGIGLNVRLGSNVTETSLTASLGIGF